jgi:hypothetical protein
MGLGPAVLGKTQAPFFSWRNIAVTLKIPLEGRRGGARLRQRLFSTTYWCDAWKCPEGERSSPVTDGGYRLGSKRGV